MDNPQIVAWSATFLCMLLSIRFATAFLQENSRLFTAMALLACAWALVLGFYDMQNSLQGHEVTTASLTQDNDIQSLPASLKERIIKRDQELQEQNKVVRQALGNLKDLATGLASFLLVYIGGLLVLETQVEHSAKRPINIVFLQRLALLMLILIAVPRALEAPGVAGKVVGLNVQETKIVLGCAVDLVGFLAVAVGAWRISPLLPLVFLLAILAFYGSLEIRSAVDYWNQIHGGASETKLTSKSLIYQLAAAKVLVTLMLGAIVAGHGMPKAMRAKGPLHSIFHFLYLA